MARRVLVTGASGFLGRACVARLRARGDDVVAFVRSGAAPDSVETVRADLAGDVTDALAWIAPPDAIVHLAQEPGWHAFPANSARIVQVAAGATAQLLEYGARVGVTRFVYASSGGVYAPIDRPIRETDAVAPAGAIGFYLAAKAAGERLVRAFQPAPFTTAVMRYFFIYGPGQRSEFLIPRLVTSVRTGAAITVAQGRGPRLNPVFVEDAAATTVAALDHGADLLLNVGGPDVRTVREIGALIGALARAAPMFQEIDDPARDYIADLTAMRAIHDPVVGLEAGLARTFESERHP